MHVPTYQYEHAPMTTMQAVCCISVRLSVFESPHITPSAYAAIAGTLLEVARLLDLLREQHFHEHVVQLHQRLMSDEQKPTPPELHGLLVQIWIHWYGTVLRENNTRWIPSGK